MIAIESFINVEKIQEELYRVFDCSELSTLKQAQKLSILRDQWDLILANPLLHNLTFLSQIISRLILSPNSEAGCEQSNSKYNRAKNKYSSTMGLEMIRARMRVGSNGPPIHLFRTNEQVKYWKFNKHRLAEKISARSNPNSQVLTRIRQNGNSTYTNTVYL